MVGLWECHHLLTPGNNSDFSHSTCSSPSVARTTGSREGNSPKKVSQRGRPGSGRCQADCPARWWGFWRPWEWRSSLPKSAVNNVHISLSPNDGSLKSHDLEVPLHLEYWLLPSLANNPPTRPQRSMSGYANLGCASSAPDHHQRNYGNLGCQLHVLARTPIGIQIGRCHNDDWVFRGQEGESSFRSRAGSSS